MFNCDIRAHACVYIKEEKTFLINFVEIVDT